MTGRHAYRNLNQTLHFFKLLHKSTAEINFLFNSQHIELNDVTVLLRYWYI